ncbi:MAG: hypothetical protein Q9200_005684 [Gallowayella weberi]
MAHSMTISVIDSQSSAVAFLECLEYQPPKSQILYCDLEGVRLSRHGSISILQIFIPHQNITFLIDVHTLGDAAFTTPSNSTGSTLKSILELESITKVFFDVRNDADALYAHFGIQLHGVHDLQLLEVASRRFDKSKVNGLARCIENDSGLDRDAKAVWKDTKQRGKILFDPEHGGSYEVFNIRPIREHIIDYCTQDVIYLPVLHSFYTNRLSKSWNERVLTETVKRLAMAKSADYDPHAKDVTSSSWPPQKRREKKIKRNGNKVPNPPGITIAEDIKDAPSEVSELNYIGQPKGKDKPKGKDRPKCTSCNKTGA